MLSEEALACGIFEQAMSDYSDLKRKGVSKHRDGSCYYSIKEIEYFLRSRWCAQLLDMIDSTLTGKEILQTLREKYTHREVEVV